MLSVFSQRLLHINMSTFISITKLEIYNVFAILCPKATFAIACNVFPDKKHIENGNYVALVTFFNA